MPARWMYSPMGTYYLFFFFQLRDWGSTQGPETAVIILPRGKDALTWLKRPPPHRVQTSFRGRVTAHDLGIVFHLGWCTTLRMHGVPPYPGYSNLDSAVFSAIFHTVP